MVNVKTVVVSVVALLSAFLQPGIKAQPTIGSSSIDDTCSQLEEESEFQDVENARLRSLLESERLTIKILENVSYSQAEENHQLNMELENKQHKIDTLENVSNSKAEEIRRLNLELAERRRLRARQLQSATATLIHRFDTTIFHQSITKVEDKIYVLRCGGRSARIKVYEDLPGYRFVRDIVLNGSLCPRDMVYSNNSKCVYINNPNENCILVMTTTGKHRLTKWPIYTNLLVTLSLSYEGHLLVLRGTHSQTSLEIYSLNATLIRRLQLPQDVKNPRHVVQSLDGNFIILHQLNNASGRPWIIIISQLTNDGELIHRFIPRNQSEELNDPLHMCLDLDNNRLFMADTYNHRVILFDSTDLTWSQVLLSLEIGGISYPDSLFYDASKKHLLMNRNSTVTVYEIN